jgi:hypothetical protein
MFQEARMTLMSVTPSMVERVRMWVRRHSNFKTITDVSEEMPASVLSADTYKPARRDTSNA